MSIGSVEPIGGVDTISFIRGAVTKYQGTGDDAELLDYIEFVIKRDRKEKERKAELTNKAIADVLKFFRESIPPAMDSYANAIGLLSKMEERLNEIVTSSEVV